VGRRFTIPVIALAAVVTASCSGAATNSPSAADSRAIGSAPPVAPRAAYKGRIAFDYRRAIWVMKADGSGRRQLTRPGAGNDFDPSWSPDGKRIVFRPGRSGPAGQWPQPAQDDQLISRPPSTNKEALALGTWRLANPCRAS
jgi:dipeptidyl aminopeptidase/acylaminoacyl peptidase